MKTSRQIFMPPMEVKKVSVTTETHGKSVSVAVDLCDLFVTAFARRGYNCQQAAGLLNMKESQFSKAFSANYPDQNTVMKRLGQVPGDVLKEFASLLAEKVGLAAGVQSERAVIALEIATGIERLLRAK